jgi:hypothetical protein
MGIWIDRNFNPSLFCIFAQSPIDVQPEGVGVEFDGHSSLTRFIDDTNHVDLMGSLAKRSWIPKGEPSPEERCSRPCCPFFFRTCKNLN